MTEFDELFPARFLSQSNVRAAPQGRLVDRIANVDWENVAVRTGGRENRPTLYFFQSRPLILNKTNGNFLRDRLGPVIENWRGARVVLEIAKLDRSFGGFSTGIRVTAAEPGGTPSARQPQREPDLIDSLAPEREAPTRDRRGGDDEDVPF
jgi:hypothetical protein